MAFGDTMSDTGEPTTLLGTNKSIYLVSTMKLNAARMGEHRKERGVDGTERQSFQLDPKR